jgi:predicted RNA-binding protein with PUA-like domain
MFILKTEPSEYSFADLQRDKRTTWSGITAAPALAHLRKARKGDLALIYHTGDEKRIVGLARLASDPRPDPSNPGLNDRGEPRFPVVDLTPVKPARMPITLAVLKADTRFAALPLITQTRLSVIPIPTKLEPILLRLAGL